MPQDNSTKRLIIAGNPFQIILAIMLTDSLFCDSVSITDILLFKSINGWEDYAKRLEGLNIFRNVYSINESQKKGNRLKKVIDLIRIIIGHGEKIDYIVDTDLAKSDYNEIWYYNYCPWFYGLLDLMRNNGVVVRFEAYMESVFTYVYLRNEGIKPPESLRFKIMRIGRHVFRKEIFIPYKGNVYVQFPEMTDYMPGVTIKTIPQCSENYLLSEQIKRVFSVPIYTDLPKFIFLASSLEIDGFGNGETELIYKIAEIVGKENLIVKTHPRDKRGVFEKAGIRVFEHGNICWEAIQTVNDFSSNIFLTIASASIINTELFTGKDVIAYYLYPLISDMSPFFREYIQKSVNETIDMVHKSGRAPMTVVLNDYDSLEKALKG